MNKIALSDLMHFLESKYQLSDATTWDHVGLQIGSEKKEIKKVLTTLDVTPCIVDYAISNNFDTIISHHPLLFHPIQSFDMTFPKNRMIKKIIEFDLNVYSMHTNFDVGLNGMNDLLANVINLSEVCEICPVSTGNGTKMIGRMGSTDLDIYQIINLFKNKLQINMVKYLDSQRPIKKVGIVGGSGAEFIKDAFESGVDLFVTGDIKYHDFLEAKISQYALLDIGHVAEKIFAPTIASLITDNFELHAEAVSFKEMEISGLEEK